MKFTRLKIGLAIAGALAGVGAWVLLVFFVLVAYWLGFHVIYIGLLCGHGKFGLGGCTPPSVQTLETTSNWVLYLTAFAFTWGVALAALVGGFFAVKTGSMWLKRLTMAHNIYKFVRGVKGNHDLSKPAAKPENE